MKVNLNCNDIIFIIIFLFIILLILFKSINIHFKFKESFENNNNNNNNTSKSIEDTINSELGDIDEKIDDAEEDIKDSLDPEDTMTTAELQQKCANLGNKKYGGIVSKYSGRMINIEFVEEGNDPNPNLSVNPESKNGYLYLIKWKPLGNKPGGCITCNANGTYSTPMCDSTVQNQLWHIVYIKNREDLEKMIPDKYRKFGRDMDKTEYPFSIILSAKYNSNRYVLNYEGGGLSIRPIANYDGIRWDVSEEGIKQELLPSQNNSKYTSLTPEHNMAKTDNSLNKFFQKATLNQDNKENNNGKSNGKGKDVNFNINLDPELLQQLGLGLNTIGSGNMNNSSIDLNSNNNINNNNSDNNNSNTGLKENTNLDEEADLLLTEEELNRRKFKNNSSGGRGNVDDMIMEGANQDPCNKCGKVPPNYIKKDLVKSMCIGCNDIDNVST